MAPGGWLARRRTHGWIWAAHQSLFPRPIDRATEGFRERRVLESELARGQRAVVAMAVEDRSHARPAHRAALPADATPHLGDRGDSLRERSRCHSHGLAHAGDL